MNYENSDFTKNIWFFEGTIKSCARASGGLKSKFILFKAKSSYGYCIISSIHSILNYFGYFET